MGVPPSFSEREGGGGGITIIQSPLTRTRHFSRIYTNGNGISILLLLFPSFPRQCMCRSIEPQLPTSLLSFPLGIWCSSRNLDKGGRRRSLAELCSHANYPDREKCFRNCGSSVACVHFGFSNSRSYTASNFPHFFVRYVDAAEEKKVH